MSPMLSVTCMGEFEARLDGVLIPALTNSKPLALWLFLALGLRESSRAQLAGLFWANLDEARARMNLRLALMRLREFASQHIHSDRHRVAIPHDCRYEIDTLVLGERIPAGSVAPEELLRLRPEEFLLSIRLRQAPQFDEWVRVERRRLVEQYLQRLTAAAQALTNTGPATLAVDLYQRCLCVAPWSEEHHRALIRLFAQTGQRLAALAQFDACRQALAREFGVAPSAETRQLAEAVKASPRVPPPPCAAAPPLPE